MLVGHSVAVCKEVIYLDAEGVLQVAPACVVLPLAGPMISSLCSLNIVSVTGSGPALIMCVTRLVNQTVISLSVGL